MAYTKRDKELARKYRMRLLKERRDAGKCRNKASMSGLPAGAWERIFGKKRKAKDERD